MLRENEDDANKWRNTLSSCIGRPSIVKMSLLPKETYRFSVIFIKIPKTVFTEAEKSFFFLIYMEPKNNPNSQSNSEEKEQS